MSPQSPEQKSAYLLLTLAALFWGGNYVAGRLMVFHLSPILLTQFRWLFTAILLAALYYKKVIQDWSQVKSSFLVLCFLALCGQVLFPLNLYIGLQYTLPLNAAIFLSATPCLVLLINKLIFKDRITKKNVVGVILSSIGVLFLLLHGKITDLKQLEMLNKGDFWAMGSAICWALYCSFLRLKNKNISGNAYVTISAIIGALILIPLSLITIGHTPHVLTGIHLNWEIIAGILYLIIFPSWLSYLCWSKGISIIGATRGEVYTHLVPLFGGGLSILFLKNPLHYYHIVSAVFIVMGIYLCSKHTKTIKKSDTLKPHEAH